MGLNFRKRSGRIANGSTLIVEGQPYIGTKVFQITFNQKKSSNDRPQGPEIPFEETPIPSPTITPTPTITSTPNPSNTPTPSLSPTPTPTPTPTNTFEIIDAILLDENTYLQVGINEYLSYE